MPPEMKTPSATTAPGLPRRRLHPVAALVSMLRALRSLVPLLIVLIVTQRGADAVLPLWVGAVVLLFGLIEGVGGWLRFYYWVEGGELRVERGLLVRRRVFIPVERIQAVDTSAGVLQRMFGVVRVEIKTASAGTQAELSAVARQDAESLRWALWAASGQHASQASEGPRDPDARYTLPLRHLLLAASTSGRLGVLLSGLGWLYSKVDDLIHEHLVRLIESLPLDASMTGANPVVLAFAISFVLLLAFVASVLAEVVRFGGFAVERSGDQIVIRRGLFERREIAVPVERIQAIRIVEGILRQPLGYAAIHVESAGHAEERGQSTQLHPFLHRSQWLPFLRAVAPSHALDAPTARGAGELRIESEFRPPRRALRRFLVRPSVMALMLLASFALLVPRGWLVLPLLAFAPWVGWLGYRDARVALQGNTIVLQRRKLRRMAAIVERRHIQFATVSSSWLQRRRGLADVTVAAASGAGGKRFSVPDLDRDAARRVLDWCAPVKVEDGAT